MIFQLFKIYIYFCSLYCFSSWYIIIQINGQNNLIEELNNIILEQNSVIIKINNICENLLLSKINNYIDNYNITKSYINYSTILILLDGILLIIFIYSYNNINLGLIILLISISISIILNIFILYLGDKYIRENFEEINNKSNEIIDKTTEIDNKYIINLMIIIDNNNDTNYINISIDEYLLNYSYLIIEVKQIIRKYNSYWHFKNKISFKSYIDKNKNNFINLELKNKLITNKNNELMNNMKIRLGNFDEIIPEIVKYELDEVNKDLEEYKKDLEIKINNLNELLQINSIIIDIS